MIIICGMTLVFTILCACLAIAAFIANKIGI